MRPRYDNQLLASGAGARTFPTISSAGSHSEDEDEDMHLDLQWQANPRAAILHALRLLADGVPMIDHAIVAVLAPWVPRLQESRLDNRFWRQLLPIASGGDELSSLVERAVKHSQLECHAGDIAEMFATAEQQVVASDLDVTAELLLRQRPLRELWEASGPGLLFQISRWTMRPILPGVELDGLLPLCGGFGQAFSGAQRVQIELVLTNPVANVPEVIRLAWLIAQLSIPDDSDVATDQLALVACCLAAAEQLGLAACQPASIAEALQQWRIVEQRADELGVAVHQWWNARNEELAWHEASRQLLKYITPS